MKRMHEKLERARAARGVPQAELSRRLGSLGLDAGKAQMSRWFSGAAVPDVAELAAIADALGVSIDYLVDDDQDKPPAGLSPEDVAVLRVARGLLLTMSLDEVVARLVTDLDDGRRAAVRAAGRARQTELGRPAEPPARQEIPRTPFRTEVVVSESSPPPAPSPAMPPPAPAKEAGSPRRSRDRRA
jgi:transcriptional regulator with XRE-family HTH domain